MLSIEAPPKPKTSNPEEIANILDQLEQYSPEEAVKKPRQQSTANEPSSEELIDEAPSPQQFSQNIPFNPQQYQPQLSSDTIQELVESVVDEKWQNIIEKFGDLGIWKERTNRDLLSLKQELLRTQDRFTQLQKAVLGKVSEYNDNISNINSEMKALEKVFEKIIDPLTTNIKELQRITDRLKK